MNTENLDTTAAEPVPQHPSVAAIQAKFNTLVDWKDFTIHFKTDKELGIKRPSFTVSVPVPSVEGIVDILQNGETKPKQLTLLQEAVQAIVYGQLRAQINELIEKGGDIAAHMIDVSKLTWESISALTKAEKAVSAIAKETWDAFSKDFVEVICRVTGREPEKATLAAKNMVNKFRQVRGKKKVLQFLQGQMDIWFSNTSPEKQEEFSEVYELLSAKVQELLAEDEESMLEDLGMED